MRSFFLLSAACALLGCTPGQSRNLAPAPARVYVGIYTSTPTEDYFIPCGIDGVGDSWSLGFRDDERQAPFLKKVTAFTGFPPLTHFIRIRGRLGPPGSYNLMFQTRQLAVDSVIEVSEMLEPCAGYGVPAVWPALPQKFSGIRGMAVTTDRTLAATMDNDRQISIWAVGSGELLRRFSSLDKAGVGNPNGSVMTFSNDGQLLAVGGRDGIVRVWKPREGRGVFTLVLKDSVDVMRERLANPPPPNVFLPPPRNADAIPGAIAFNKPGTMLATTNGFSTIIWSMQTGKRMAEFNRGNDFFRKIFFVGDDGLLMTADSGEIAIRQHLGATPLVQPGTRAKATEHMTISPDERWLAVNGWGDSVFLWSVAAQAPGPVLPVPAFVTGVMAFSPDGNTIATAGGSQGLYLWDIRTGGTPIMSFHNFPGPISRAWFSADGKSIITFSTFDDRFRIVYVDSAQRAAAAARGLLQDDSLTAKLPLGPPPSTTPRTVGGVVTSTTNQRAVADAEVTISEANAPDSVVARTTTSSGGYFSFPGIRFRHVVVHVRKIGFQTGVKYIHLNRWADEGPWSIELTPSIDLGVMAATGGG
ncbi:MAG TPA: carboxypeptidase regulatory-like domain-containing protein [Gemmatimonadaceae bacterium]|nr:carboxypeptidase regulatory-like domain-containing protein [Gemmatimonadaceae bacterium]